MDAIMTQSEFSDARNDERNRTQPFTTIFDHYALPIYRYLLSWTGNVDEAKDLTSQTFLSAIEAYPRYKERGNISAWLFSIARRKYVDRLRSLSRQQRLIIAGSEDPDADVLSQLVATERIADIKKRIRSLPEKDQELLRLRFAVGLSFSEMSHILKRKEGAVKKSLYRLLARLQRQMEHEHE